MPKSKETTKEKQSLEKLSLETLLQHISEQNIEILSRLKSLAGATNATHPDKALGKGYLLAKQVKTEEAEFLLHHPTFNHFTLEDSICLFSVCKVGNYKIDEILFKEGDIGDSLFIIKSGEVKVYKKDVLGEVEVARLGAGTIFGEIAVIDNKPRSANIKTASNAELLEMSRDNYHTLLKEYPAVGVKFMDILLNTLATRLRETDRKIFKLATRF